MSMYTLRALPTALPTLPTLSTLPSHPAGVRVLPGCNCVLIPSPALWFFRPLLRRCDVAEFDINPTSIYTQTHAQPSNRRLRNILGICN